MNALQVSCKIFELEEGDIIDTDKLSKKYKLLALKNHPDKNPNFQNATERYKKLKAAYDFLRERVNSGKNSIPIFNNNNYNYYHDNNYHDDNDDNDDNY